MYLLEETPEARAMRQNVINLLQSGEQENIELAFQLIEGGGMHDDFEHALEAYLKRDDIYIFVNLIMLQILPIKLLLHVHHIIIEDYFEKNLPEKIFLCENLRVFQLSNSSIGSLPENVGNWKKLKALTLKNTPITTLPASVRNWEQLRIIRITHCSLAYLPETVGSWTNLMGFNFAYNQFTSLPASAKNWAFLRNIDISGNPIPNLPTQLQKEYWIRGDWQELLAQINGTQ